MLQASSGDWPDWIQAIGVIFALGVSAYQLRQQNADAKDSARRHEQAERETAARHRQEMEDRRRERLLTHYPVLAQSVFAYLSNMTIAQDLQDDVRDYERAYAQSADPKMKESAATAQQGVMQYRALAREAMARATTAHLAIRFDEEPPFVAHVDELMNRVASWRSGSTEAMVGAAFDLVSARGDALRPKAASGG